MIRFSDLMTASVRSPRVLRRARLATLLAGTLSLSPVVGRAAVIDWNASTGNWNVATNWYDYAAAAAPALPPGAADETHIRNNGTATLSDNQTALSLNLGFARNVELDPVGAPGVLTDVGLDGALNLTAGTFSPTDLFIGKAHNGVVTQSGGELSVPANATDFDLGDGGAANLGTGTYTMTGGTITMTGGTNGNNGIEVINGAFNLKGGTINQTGGSSQRVFRIGTKNATTATVNITSGTVNAPTGGIRVGDGGTSTGVLNINQNDGTTNIFVGGDLAVGRNATSLGKMTMSAGSVTIGTASASARFQVGNSGLGQGDMTGGSIEAFSSFRLGQAQAAQGSYFNLLGGTLTTRGFDSRTDNAVAGTPEVVGSRFTIDGGTYNMIGTNTMDIGQKGKILVELKSGSATVPSLQMGASVDSKATLSISGGTFTLGGNLSRAIVTGNDANGNPMTAPVVNLTGGNLVLNPPSSFNWQADFINQGSTVTTKAAGIIQTNVGDATHPGNFEMSSGAWNLEIGGNTVATGADRFVAAFAGATGKLTGGTINLSYLAPYTPTIGDQLMIVRVPQTGSITLNAPNVTLNTPGGDPKWRLITAVNGVQTYDIRLEYIPEPTSCVLVAVGLMVGLCGSRRRS